MDNPEPAVIGRVCGAIASAMGGVMMAWLNARSLKKRGDGADAKWCSVVIALGIVGNLLAWLLASHDALVVASLGPGVAVGAIVGAWGLFTMFVHAMPTMYLGDEDAARAQDIASYDTDVRRIFAIGLVVLKYAPLGAFIGLAGTGFYFLSVRL